MGKIKCPSCGNYDDQFKKGLIKCKNCDGKGVKYGWSSSNACNECNGSGFKKCPNCNGRGEIDG